MPWASKAAAWWSALASEKQQNTISSSDCGRPSSQSDTVRTAIRAARSAGKP